MWAVMAYPCMRPPSASVLRTSRARVPCRMSFLGRATARWHHTQLAMSSFPDLDAIVVIDGPGAHVRVALVDGGVDRGAPFRGARPSSLGARDDPGPDAIADVGDGEERAAAVRDAHLVAGGQAPWCRILGMDYGGRDH